MSSDIIQSPLVTSSPWVHGEGINHVKLHNRIDLPLETLGQYARGYGLDFEAAWLSVTAGTAVPGSTNVGGPYIKWQASNDTHNGYDATTGIYTFHRPGTYVVTAQFLDPSSTSYRLILTDRGVGTADPAWPIMSPISDGTAQGGPQISATRRFAEGDTIACQHTTTSVNALSDDCCYMFIQQVTY